ncbi:hypothetical protein MKO06_15650 [Gramella sp. GC03-9]|uniref:Uncharacterized protein n=1 Tax=Christiangramia oceanisediminis TaxID=2920386 RepID=A0A9X2L003_9FLAO|nr:hypothetical protein [Gramella oceanisediminis]MCP9201344.1 hypothetical protein [Gramella oceanisediminis]
MKKFIFTILLSVATNFSGYDLVSNPELKNVFICNSQNGKKYHFSKSCRGLNACRSNIKEITLENAKKLGKTICGWED